MYMWVDVVARHVNNMRWFFGSGWRTSEWTHQLTNFVSCGSMSLHFWKANSEQQLLQPMTSCNNYVSSRPGMENKPHWRDPCAPLAQVTPSQNTCLPISQSFFPYPQASAGACYIFSQACDSKRSKPLRYLAATLDINCDDSTPLMLATQRALMRPIRSSPWKQKPNRGEMPVMEALIPMWHK